MTNSGQLLTFPTWKMCFSFHCVFKADMDMYSVTKGDPVYPIFNSRTLRWWLPSRMWHRTLPTSPSTRATPKSWPSSPSWVRNLELHHSHRQKKDQSWEESGYVANQSGETQSFFNSCFTVCRSNGVMGYNWCDVEKAGQLFNVLNQPVSNIATPWLQVRSVSLFWPVSAGTSLNHRLTFLKLFRRRLNWELLH